MNARDQDTDRPAVPGRADAHRHLPAGQPRSYLMGLPVDRVKKRFLRHLQPPRGPAAPAGNRRFLTVTEVHVP
jgi:hypothetical protein